MARPIIGAWKNLGKSRLFTSERKDLQGKDLQPVRNIFYQIYLIV